MSLLRPFICAVLIAAVSFVAAAEPFVPESDGQVLERLPFGSSDPVIRHLRLQQTRLNREPDNLPLALRVARGYLELGRASGDPRYGGYAEAALVRWWQLERPPQEVLVLRATLHQRLHEFDAALADLATVLSANPRDVQARLTRATVLQVQGAYESAREECRALQNISQQLVWVACLASVNGATGKLHESYRQLRSASENHPNAQPEVRSWVLTSLAEMAARADMTEEAETHFRAALGLDAADTYLLSAYADFLLDSQRSREVLALLRDKTRADPLLLRYALGLQAQRSKELSGRVEQLRDRFAASRLRGDRVHLREEARFTLHLQNAPEAALKLAQENWLIQKEPADVRILLEAALAAHDDGSVGAVREWLQRSGLEDEQLKRLAPETEHPR